MDAAYFTTWFLFCLHQVAQSSPLWGPHGIAKNIRNLPCVSRKTGEKGTCMFAFTCAKMYGTHLGTCIDRFYFGSCCKLPNGSDIDVAPPIDDNRIGEGERTTTPRIRPAITQKPQTPGPTRRPPVTVLNNVTISSSPSPVTSSQWLPPNSRPPPTTPPPNSAYSPSTPSSVFNTSSFPQAVPTTAPPTLVTWTTVEEAPSPQAPINPQVSSVAPPTHRPVFGSSSVSIIPPTKSPSTPSSFTSTSSRPSTSPSTRPPASSSTSKPFVSSSKPAPSSARPPVKPSTPRPPVTTKPPAPSTTWVPVSVSTHAPSTTKKPSTKKPVTSSNKPVTSTNQSAVNVLHVSSTAKPVSVTPSKPSIITAKPPFSTLRPSPSSTKPALTSPSPSPSSPSSTTSRPSTLGTTPNRPSTFPSSTLRPVIVSSTGKPVITASWPSSTPAASTLTSAVSSLPPIVSTLGPSSSTLQPVQVTTTTASSTSTSRPSTVTTMGGNATGVTSTTALPPEFNEVEFNMSNYKDVCGRRLFPEARVVGGQLSSFGKWPWQISLRQWRTSTYLHKCGAALLSENWAITAAHCVENVPPSDLLLRLGEHDLSTEEEPYGYQERRVQIVASHPQFDPRTFEYDLALLRFYEPVVFQPNIIPICVPEDETNFVGSVAYVTGWGRLYEDGPLPSILQEVSVPVINNTLCETMYRAAGYIEHIPDIFICAGWKKGGFDSCEGDSGGPMVIQRPDKRWLLAGVISWGIGCAEPNQPGVYTRISQFRHWINQILQF